MVTRPHGAQSVSWWGATNPGTNVALGAASWVGGTFTTSVAGRVNGFRTYLGSGQSLNGLAAIWDANTGQLYRCVALSGYNGGTGGWAQVWMRPWFYWATSVGLRVGVLMQNEYSRHATFLGTGLTHGNITFLNSWQSTSITPWGTTLTTNANANGIDLLYLPN